MRYYIFLTYTVLFLSLQIISEGCGNNRYSENNEIFSQVITQYLRKESYDLKIKELSIVSIEGNEAEVNCKLTESGDSYGLSVTWTFNLKRKDETWTVTKHSRK